MSCFLFQSAFSTMQQLYDQDGQRRYLTPAQREAFPKAPRRRPPAKCRRFAQRGYIGRSPIDYGAVWLKVVQEPSKEMIGHYRTDRETAGEMELSNRQSRKFQTFESAQKYLAAIAAG
jgi:hypothetical protein